MIKKLFLALLMLPMYLSMYSQEVVDQVVAVVGNEIIMKSEIENQYIQMQSQQQQSTGDMKCEILEDMLFQKLLYVQAGKDSIEVSAKEIETELDRRLSVFVNQLGSEEKLEEYYGKSMKTLKADFKDIIKEQLLAQKVQQKIIGETKVTPSEVKKYFEQLPQDSIPQIDAYFELSEIVIKPQVKKEDKDFVINELNKIRERILSGDNFATMAILYSEDQGSAIKGGELGFVSKTDLVPEFSQVAFNLTSPEEISRVVETEYGFHIIQLIEKRGNMMNFRHILMKPKVSMDKLEEADKKANMIYNLIKTDSISFLQAVAKYSDGESKVSDGKMTNPYYGDSKLTYEFIDNYTSSAVSPLKVGEYSKPFLATDNKGSKVIKIVKLDLKVDSHKANLKDDYQVIQQHTLEAKNDRLINEWLSDKVQSIYVRIDKSYSNCNFKFKNWTK